MYLTILSLPFFAAVTGGLFGRKIGVQGSQIITCSSLVLTTVLAMIAFLKLYFQGDIITISITQWVNIESSILNFELKFDSLTLLMCLPVLIVSSLVHIYSIGYMSHDPHNQRFFSYLSMFTFAMLILITAENYLLIFCGWEGVGVSSYLLVSFWYTRIQANKSAISAMLMNRVGDTIFTLGLILIFTTFYTLDSEIIFSLAPYINTNIITIIGILLLIGAMAKSAQLGLHIWLPNAMEGPTPVSALIHAATMVTAGVYLLIRTSPLIEYSSTVLILTLWVGALTAIFAATVGLFQNDIKKIIAFSTCSQLGMMFIAIGLSQYNLALYHLSLHAYFKALLFLAAGSVIHSVLDEQDIRKYGGLVKFIPFTYIAIFIGSFSLMAIPFMSGFYSKDLIIETALSQYLISGHIIFWITTISAMFTSLYSVKLLYFTFLSYPNGVKSNYVTAHEPVLTMGIPLIILSILSIFSGYLLKDMMIGLGSPFLNNSIFLHPNHHILIETEFGLNQYLKILPLILTLVATIAFIFLYEFLYMKYTELTYLNKSFQGIYSFFNQRHYLDLLLHKNIISPNLKIGYILLKEIDKGLLEFTGPTGGSILASYISKRFTSLDTANITNYALYIIIGFIIFIIIYFITEVYLIVLLSIIIILEKIQVDPLYLPLHKVK